MEVQVRGSGGFRCKKTQRPARRELPVKTDVRRAQHGSFHFKGNNFKIRLGSCKQRELTESIVKDYDISVSRACKLTYLPRKMYYY
jgi:hypothetical protein